MKQKIVVTGGTGRVGQALLSSKRLKNYEIHVIVRRKEILPRSLRETPNLAFHEIHDLARCNHSDLLPIFRDAASLVHLAATISEGAPATESATALMAKNVAHAVAETGVPNVVVLSSIYARLALEGAANARTYGYRKLAAEKFFSQMPQAQHSIVVLRPPAVYGPGMGGTLNLLIKLVKARVPLPLGLAEERRDYISISNLTDLIWTVVDKQLKNPVVTGVYNYEPSDGEPITTKALTKQLAHACGRKALLLPVPTTLLNFAGKILAKEELIEGALEGLEAEGNISLFDDFGWRPIEQMPESLQYLAHDKGPGSAICETPNA